MGRVDGLCGLYNDVGSDDLTQSDGRLALSTDQFADSWTVSGYPPLECHIQLCPFNIQKAAWKKCAFLRFTLKFFKKLSKIIKKLLLSSKSVKTVIFQGKNWFQAQNQYKIQFHRSTFVDICPNFGFPRSKFVEMSTFWCKIQTYFSFR